jgi:hypothetical protein
MKIVKGMKAAMWRRFQRRSAGGSPAPATEMHTSTDGQPPSLRHNAECRIRHRPSSGDWRNVATAVPSRGAHGSAVDLPRKPAASAQPAQHCDASPGATWVCLYGFHSGRWRGVVSLDHTAGLCYTVCAGGGHQHDLLTGLFDHQ